MKGVSIRPGLHSAGVDPRWRIWTALGGVVLVFAVLLVPVGKPIRDPWGAGAWNLLHLPGFFFLTRCFLRLFGAHAGRRQRVFFAAAVSFAAGAITEVLQGLTGRSASLDDLILDAVGIALAVIWPRTHGIWTKMRLWTWLAVLAAGVTFAFSPALILGWTRFQAGRHLPVIAGVSEATDLRLWKSQGEACVEWNAVPGTLSVRTSPGEAYSGTSFLPGRQDWSEYSELELTLFNPGKAFRLGVRIDDEDSALDRIWFSDEEEVKGGDSVVRIHLPRVMDTSGRRCVDLSRISRLALFVEKDDSPVEFSIRSAILR